MQHMQSLSMDDLDQFVHFKLNYEDEKTDQHCYNVMQIQEMIRKEFFVWKGPEKVAVFYLQIFFFFDVKN